MASDRSASPPDAATGHGSAPHRLRVCCFPSPSTTLSEFNWLRLFHGQHLSPARRRYLAESTVVLVTCDGEVVGFAAYKLHDGSARLVHEFVADPHAACGLAAVVNLLAYELEAVSRADRCDYVLLIAAGGIRPALLAKRGYTLIVDDCAGAWFEKRLRESGGGLVH